MEPLDKPKILVCSSSPEGVADFLRERFVGQEIVVINHRDFDQIQGQSFDKIWIDELVDILTPKEGDYFHPDQCVKRWEDKLQALVIDKPIKHAKLRKQKHTTPFWANDYRRK